MTGTLALNLAGAAVTLFVMRLAFVGLGWNDMKRTWRVLRNQGPRS